MSIERVNKSKIPSGRRLSEIMFNNQDAKTIYVTLHTCDPQPGSVVLYETGHSPLESGSDTTVDTS